MTDDLTPTAAETGRLWLRALAELDPRDADSAWSAKAQELALALRTAAADEGSLVSLINQALVLQQFLLEVACRPTGAGDRDAIVHQAGRLLAEDPRFELVRA